ncbi:Purine ribonucleoside efflux pump NepI [Enterobacter cloacae]
MSSCVAAREAVVPAKPAWRAVYSLGLGVFGLITAEFLPASLLTPMAASLGVTEGMAGQAVTATALVALVTGLLITPATKSIDRRWVLMFFSVLQIVSSLLVAFAPHAARTADGTPAVRDCHRGILGDVDRHGDASGACR